MPTGHNVKKKRYKFSKRIHLCLRVNSDLVAFSIDDESHLADFRADLHCWHDDLAAGGFDAVNDRLNARIGIQINDDSIGCRFMLWALRQCSHWLCHLPISAGKPVIFMPIISGIGDILTAKTVS